MKKYSCTALLKEEQDEDVVKAFEAVLRRHGHEWSRERLYAEVAGMRAPRWYVSRPRAMAVLYRMERGEAPRESGVRGRMWADLYAAVKRRQAAEGVELRRVVRRVLLEEAPSFYLKAGVIKNIVLRSSKR